MLEAEDDPDVFAALFEAAEAWLRAEGMRRVRGPFSLSINDECGLLVEGFDIPPAFMMGHAPPYYAERIEALGFAKVKDLLAYRIDTQRLPAFHRRVQRRQGDRVTTRTLDRSRLAEELALMRDIFNDAWADNWGFVPFTEAEFAELGKLLAHVVDADAVRIGSVAGQPAGMIVCLPDVNRVVGDLNGRLLPFGWLRLLWRLKRAPLAGGRIALMGVRREHQASLIGSSIAFRMIGALESHTQRRGMTEVEFSWLLEDNTRVIGICEAMGAKLAKRYRLYEKALA
jgi:hypothetical protein